MSETKKGFFRRTMPLWKGINTLRKIVLNIVFFVAIIVVLSLLLSDGTPKVPEQAALVLTPDGAVVEQLSDGGPGAGIRQMMGMGTQETLLKDLLDSIRYAKEDSRIKVLVLNLNRMGNVLPTKLVDLKHAILDFKKSGKKVIAVADNYGRDTYYLAALADTIYLHQMGAVALEGYGRYQRYFKEGLDKLEVDVNVFKVGKYKSAIEPYIRNDMSEAAKEANEKWLNILWTHTLNDIAQSRGLKVEDLNNYMDKLTEKAVEYKGYYGKLALETKLVDKIGHRDLYRDDLIKLVGEDDATHSFNQIDHSTYLQAQKHDRYGDQVSGDAIGVIVAQGTILNGNQPAGTIGGDSTAKLIRQARKDKNIKAIVLRIDSGGGSAFASEVIRREMELARKDGKPVIASMGSIAASGGYWITMSSDEVWAYPNTITGSIGVFGMVQTYQKPMAKHLGMHVDGVGTNKMAGAMRFDREMNEELKPIIQQGIERIYDEFITKTATARNMKVEDIDKVAQGRVWAGEDAKELGLIDQLGTFEDALKSAAKKAKLSDDFKVKYIRKEISFKEKLMSKFFAQAYTQDELDIMNTRANTPLMKILLSLEKQTQTFAQFNDPNGVYAYAPLDVE